MRARLASCGSTAQRWGWYLNSRSLVFATGLPPWHTASPLCCLLTRHAAQDYVRHTKRLLRDFDDVLQPAVAAAAPAAANGAAASVLPSVNGSAAPVNAGAAATAAAAASAPAPAGGAFGLPPASGGLGSILGLPAPGAAPAAPAPFAGFSFAPAASAPAPGGGAFGAPPAGGFAGFGGCGAAPEPLAAPSLPGAGGGGGGGGGGGEGAEEEEGPKEFVPEVKVDDGGSAFLFRGRAKVYVQGADKARLPPQRPS